MASPEQRAITLGKVKTDLRIVHTALDTDINDQINACLGDLNICGIAEPDETDPTILSAIKLFCRASYTDDTTKASAYLQRYDALKATLMMAEDYGGNYGT